MPDLTFDKLHEECGVFAIYGHPEAANLAYLGLYALQHRGQESAGIASSDGRKIHCIRKMGHVADIFTPDALNQLPGELAIGHTRYSTTGDTVILNAQPLSVACNKGQIAVAHNGNITNAAELRSELEREGSFFRQPATPRSYCTWWLAPVNGRCRRHCAMHCCSLRAPFHWCLLRKIASSSLAIRTVSGRLQWASLN